MEPVKTGTETKSKADVSKGTTMAGVGVEVEVAEVVVGTVMIDILEVLPSMQGFFHKTIAFSLIYRF